MLHHQRLYQLTTNCNNIRLRHVSNRQEFQVKLAFPHSQIKYYRTVHIGNLRLSTHTFHAKKTADDSNIVFRMNNTEKFGRIRSIFTIDGQAPVLLISYLSRFTLFSAKVDEQNIFTYEKILSGSTSDWTTCFIELQDFVEKCAYYDDHIGGCTFFRFPTLQHST